MAQHPEVTALGVTAARQLPNATKTTAQLSTISPRWLVHLLQWLPVEAGIYRLNQVKNPADVRVACAHRDESELPQTYVYYDEQPREYFLNAVSNTVPAFWRRSEMPRSVPVFRLRSSSWKTSWMLSSLSGPSMAMAQAAPAKMWARSRAERACTRAA